MKPINLPHSSTGSTTPTPLLHRFTLALGAAVLLASLFTPSTASAALFGAYAQGQTGYSSISEDLSGFSYGWTVGVELLNIQAFLDSRHYLGGGQANELGLGYNLGFSLLFFQAYVRPALGLIQVKEVANRPKPSNRLGLNGSLQAGLDYEVFKFLHVGVQGNTGYILEKEQSDKHMSVMGVLRLKI